MQMLSYLVRIAKPRPAAYRLKPVSGMENRLKPGCLAAQAPQRQCVSTHFACQTRVSTLVYLIR